MPRLLIIAALAMATVLSACTEPDTYPLTGEECSEEDLVQGLDSSDCIPPSAGMGTF